MGIFRPLLRRSAVWLGVMVTLSACSSNLPTPGTANEVAQQTNVASDEFKTEPTYWGPQTSFDIDRGQYKDRVKWRANARRLTPGAPLSVFVLIEVYHVDRIARSYQTASFVGGESVPAERLNYSPICTRLGCSHDESFVIVLPPARVAAGTDQRIRLNASNGMHVELTLPSHYIAGLMARAK